MINIHASGVAARDITAPRIYRISPRGFWALFALEGLLVGLVVLAAIYFILPTRAPLAQSADYATVREAVWLRLNGAVNDPLIEIAPGVDARSSSIRGFALNGQTYYYYLEGQRGFDPLSRGVVSTNDIEVLLRDEGGPRTLVIYRLTR